MRDSSKSLFYFFTTILCLTVFSAALLISEDVLQLDISGDTIDFGNNTGVVSDADSADTSPGISLTLHDEKLEKLKSQSLGGIVALAVGVVFSLLVAMLQPSMALLFLLAAFLLVAGMGISFGVASADSVVASVLIGLAAVFACYLFCKLLQRSANRRKVRHFFEPYVPSNLTDYYRKNPAKMAAVSESRELTILFCDIKKFTSIAETLDPARLHEWLNAYFVTVSHVIDQHGGTVDKYMGDSVMAFWGAPWASETHASDALRASQQIQREVAALAKRMNADGLPEITIGIGISTGFANVGHMGSEYRMTYTAVGDPVNTANRLQRCTGYYDLPMVVSSSTVEKVPEFLFRELDTVHVKGRQRFVQLFELICPVADASPELLKRLQLHRKAMQFYRSGMWNDAERLFEVLGNDSVDEREYYQRYIDRIRKIRNTRPKHEDAHIVDFTGQMR